MVKDIDLSELSDEELEQEGFTRGEARAEAERVHRAAMLEVQAEITRRSDARGGAAKPQPTED